MKKAEYDMQYAKDHLKRYPLDLTHADFDILKMAAESAGETVAAYIKRSIALRMLNDDIALSVPDAEKDRATIRGYWRQMKG